jgi:hypothetical protein
MGMQSGTGTRAQNARMAQEAARLQLVLPMICRFYVGLGVMWGLLLAIAARAYGWWLGR